MYYDNTLETTLYSVHYSSVADKDLDGGGCLAIDVYDYDKASKRDEEIGSAALPLSMFKDAHHWQGWLPIRSKLYVTRSRGPSLDNAPEDAADPDAQKPTSPEMNSPDSPITIAKSGTSETEDVSTISLDPVADPNPAASHELPPKQVLSGIYCIHLFVCHELHFKYMMYVHGG